MGAAIAGPAGSAGRPSVGAPGQVAVGGPGGAQVVAQQPPFRLRGVVRRVRRHLGERVITDEVVKSVPACSRAIFMSKIDVSGAWSTVSL